MTERMSAEQFEQAGGVGDWRVVLDGARAHFRTGSFAAGVALVDAIGRLADAANHHPDVDLRYGSVAVRLWTHDVEGLSERDVELARQVSAAARELGVPADPGAGRSVAGAMPALTVVALTGLPGTGKSTLAELLARATGTPAFAGDWLLGALAPHGILDVVDRPTTLAVHFGLLDSLVTRQLRLGQSAVVDCVLDDAGVAAWRATAAAHGGRLVVVECVCSDEGLHRRRVEGRRRGIPGWHEIGWDHVERMRAESRPVADRQLVLDAVEPIEDNLRRLGALLDRPAPGR